jgi:hypothetical protein
VSPISGLVLTEVLDANLGTLLFLRCVGYCFYGLDYTFFRGYSIPFRGFWFMMGVMSRRRPRPTPQPVELTPGDKFWGATFDPRSGFQAGTKPMSETAKQAQMLTSFLNPLATVTEKALAGETPKFSDYATDAGFLAASFIPFVGPGLKAGGQAAKTGAGLTVTGTGDAGRLSALVRRLNKSEDVGDFITPESMSNMRRPNDAFEGLYRPGAQSFDHSSVPTPASPYTFGLVPTEKLAPLREFDRWNELTEVAEGTVKRGRGNVKQLMDHLGSGGKLSDPLSVSYFPETGAGYLAEGNHRLAMAQQLGLEQLPLQVWRNSGALGRSGVGRNIGDLDTNQLAKNQFSDFLDSVGPYYVPPVMHPYLLKYFQQ